MAGILSGLSEEHSIDLETIEAIAYMPPEKTLTTSYNFLTQAGLNADKILADFISSKLGDCAEGADGLVLEFEDHLADLPGSVGGFN
jgi:hypothetical protein